MVGMLRELLRRVRPFRVGLKGLDAFANDAGTRSFLALRVTTGFQEVRGEVANMHNYHYQVTQP